MTIDNVIAAEIIDPAWGNAVADQLNAAPLGVMGYAEVDADQNSINAVADLTSLTVTWTASAGRLYRISFRVALDLNWSASTMQPVVYVTDGSNAQTHESPLGVYAQDVLGIAVSDSVIESGLTGSITRKLRATSGSGVGDTIDLSAGSTARSYILVEDLGLA